MENKNAHANVDSKLEAVQNSRVIREATEKSIQLSKSIFRKESQTVSKVVQAKELQESKRVPTLQRIASIKAAILGGSN